MSAETVSLAPASEANKKSTWAQELSKVVIPSLITAVCGFFIWNAQTDIEQKVTNSNQILRTQMALKEEFYKRRLTKYEDACTKIAGVGFALGRAEAVSESDTQATDRLAELDEIKRSNALYWSDDLDKRLGVLWALGIDKLRYKHFDKTTNENIQSEILSLHKQMKADLALKEIAWISESEKESE